MDVLEAMEARRSIRCFSGQPVEHEKLERVLHAAVLAPSAKNRQNWRFVVVQRQAKAQMLEKMAEGIEACASGKGLFQADEPLLADARNSAAIMGSAPAVIFVVNTEGEPLDEPLSPAERLADLLGTQSVSAAAENLLLAAQELGLGTLWVGNVFFACRELTAWLELAPNEQIAAAVAIGYPAEASSAVPQKERKILVQWRI